jgi:hypothetical protein
MTGPSRDRRRPINGNGYELREAMGKRVPVDRYTDVLNALLVRANADLRSVETGRLSDSASEREAREEVRHHLTVARDALLEALRCVQKIRDPRLKFTPGVINVGPRLTKEKLTDEAEDVVWTRHVRGHWGAATLEEKATNEGALQVGHGRLISRHKVGDFDVIIVTEADRSGTAIMVVELY